MAEFFQWKAESMDPNQRKAIGAFVDLARPACADCTEML